MAAESAELQLRVSLDLTTLRRQLAGIGTELSGQGLNLPIGFDRKSISSEFQRLRTYVGNKKFNIEINTNLSGEIDKAKNLAEAINQLSKATRGLSGISSAAGPQGLRGLILDENTSRKQLQALYKFARAANLPFQELARGAASSTEDLKRVLFAGFGSIGDDAKAGISNALKDADSTLAKLGRDMGEALLGGLRTDLGIASPSKETAKLGKFAAEGFEKGFIAGMIKAERTIARAVSNAVIGAIYEGLTTAGNIAPAFAPLERALAAQIRQSFQRAMHDGIKGSILPGAQGGLLGLLGGGATGAAIGGARALGGAATAGLSSLAGGGRFEMAKQLGRLTIGDTSGLTNFVQDATAQAMHQAFSTGTLGALIGAAAVGGVAGSSGFVRGAIGSLTRQILEGIADRILAGIASITSGDIGPAMGRLSQAIINVLVRDLERRVQSMNISFPSMLPALPPAYRGLPQAGGNAFGALPPAYRGLPGRTTSALPPAYRGLPMGGFDFAAMGAMPQGGTGDNQGGKIVSLQSGFIVSMRERFARAAERYLFGIETQVVDLFDSAEAAVRVKIDQAMARLESQIRAGMAQKVSVRDLGNVVQPALPGAVPKRQLALPAAGGTGEVERCHPQEEDLFRPMVFLSKACLLLAAHIDRPKQNWAQVILRRERQSSLLGKNIIKLGVF
jgi:hypothetical protein